MKHPACLFIHIIFDISRALFLTSVARRYTNVALHVQPEAPVRHGHVRESFQPQREHGKDDAADPERQPVRAKMFAKVKVQPQRYRNAADSRQRHKDDGKR